MPTNNPVTITGTIGPGIALTTLANPNTKRLTFDFERQVIEVTDDQNFTKTFSLNDIDTETMTFAAKGGVVTVSITT